MNTSQSLLQTGQLARDKLFLHMQQIFVKVNCWPILSNYLHLQMLGRQYLNESAKDSCRLVLHTLSKEIIGLCSILEDGSHYKTEAIVVNSLSLVVYSTLKEKEIQATLFEKLPQVLSWCENILKVIC